MLRTMKNSLFEPSPPYIDYSIRVEEPGRGEGGPPRSGVSKFPQKRGEGYINSIKRILFLYLWFYRYKDQKALGLLHPLGSSVVPLIREDSQAGYNTSFTHTHILKGGGGWEDTMAISPFFGAFLSDLAF